MQNGTNNRNTTYVKGAVGGSISRTKDNNLITDGRKSGYIRFIKNKKKKSDWATYEVASNKNEDGSTQK